MKDWFVEYFASFSRRERNGIFIFSIVIILIIATRIALPFIFPSKPINPLDYYTFIKPEKPFKQINPFAFDPNQVTKEELDSMKIPTNISSNLLNYTSKGGVFYQSTDLKKIYGLTDSIFYLLEPFIAIEEQAFKNQFETDTYEENNFPEKKIESKEEISFFINVNMASKDSLLLFGFSNFSANNIISFRSKGGKFYQINDLYNIYGTDKNWINSKTEFFVFPETPEIKEVIKPIQKIDINLANESDLQNVKGIGKVFSKRILDYKVKLGGIYKPEQILEVYGMQDFEISEINKHFYFSDSLCTKIDLNKIEFNDLLKHPYFEYYLVKQIFDIKNEIKKPISLSDLENNKAFLPQELEKVKPYLK